MRSVPDTAGPGSAADPTPPGMLAKATRPETARRVTIAPKPTEADGTQEGKAGASVLLNGLKVLEAFSIDEPLLGVTEIAGRVGMHKSSVSRILAVLEQMHYVERDSDTGRFRLGLGVIALAGPLLADLDVRRAAHPALERLSQRTGETAALLVWNGHETIVVEQVASTHQVKHTAAIGTRYDSAESASVQIFLADLQWGEVLRMFDRRVLAGAHDPDSVAEYQRMLATVRQRGYAINDGRTSAEEVGLAARVRDHRGETVAAVLLSAPRFRISTQMLEPLARTVADAGQEVAERLGYRSQLPVDGPKTETDRSSAIC